MESKEKKFWQFIRDKGYIYVKKWGDTEFQWFLKKTKDESILFNSRYVSYFVWRSHIATCPLPTPEGKFWCRRCQTLHDESYRSHIKETAAWCYKCYAKWRGIKGPNEWSFYDKVQKKNATPWEIRKRQLYLTWFRRKVERDHINSNPAVKLTKRMRTQISQACSGLMKWPEKSNAVIGLPYDDFMDYLSTMFTSDMSWDNYGSYWHVHHIIPLDIFSGDVLTTKKLFFHRNLMPLPASENLKIHTKVVPELLNDWHYENFDVDDLISKK